jgi:hypothetical protein
MKEDLSNAHRQSWIEAKDKECNSFKERQTYITPRIPIADIPKDLIIPRKMVFDIKKHPDGSFDSVILLPGVIAGKMSIDKTLMLYSSH